MAPYQQRVVDERAALDEKIVALLKFLGTSIYHDLDAEEKTRLQRQYSAMQEYSDVLDERIAAFRDDV